MKARTQDQVEKLQMTIGSAAIALVVSLVSIAAAALGLAQMA